MVPKWERMKYTVSVRNNAEISQGWWPLYMNYEPHTHSGSQKREQNENQYEKKKDNGLGTRHV